MANKLDHVAFNVPDVRKAAEDFNKAFGIGSVLVFNEPLGLYIAVSDIGLVLSQEIDPVNNPSSVKKAWNNDFVTAIEIKVPDRDAVHEKMLAHGVKPIFEMYSNYGFREWFYSGENFYGFPSVVTEYASESIIEAVDSDLSESPEEYGMELTWNWEPGWEGWSRKGNDYPDLADNIPATSDSRVGSVVLNVPGNVEAMSGDFNKLFGMDFITVTDNALGIRLAIGNDGYAFAEPAGSSKIESNFGADVLQALEIKVSDLDAADKNLQSMGVKPIYERSTPGGLRERYYEKSNLSGIPVLVRHYDGPLLDAIAPGLKADPGKYPSEVKWL